MVQRKRIHKSVLDDVSEGGKAIWETVKAELLSRGVDIDELCDISGKDRTRVKVVCVTPDLAESVEEMGRSNRDQVIMVRVDEETSHDLDAWVESGAVKSRSEAAALFIREGLKVRGSELDQLRDALKDVESAKERLRDRAKEVFGEPIPES